MALFQKRKSSEESGYERKNKGRKRKDMERLTKRDEYGNAEIIGVDDMKIEYDVGADDYDKITDVIDKLAEYEDLEEQGKLLRLPCAVGDTVHGIMVDENNFEHFHCGTKISEIPFDYWMLPVFGKSIFLTKEEAEVFSATLEKLSGDTE